MTAGDAAPAGSTRNIWLLAFVGALVLYVGTANRVEQWQDSGWQQFRIVSGQVDHPRGLALAHPVQYYLGRVALRLGIAEPAFAITLVSALAAAIAIANLAAILWMLTRQRLATAIPVVALLFSHTFWFHATHTESYTLIAALLTGEWLCLALFAKSPRWALLCCVLFLNGLGVANHLMAILVTPVNVAIIIWAVRSRTISVPQAFLGASLWIVGTLPWLLLIVTEIVKTGAVAETLHGAFFGRSIDAVLNVQFSTSMLALSVAFVAYNFPGLVVPLAMHGCVHSPCLPRWLRRVWIAEFVILAVFVLRYPVADQYTFFVPVYVMAALFAGVGLHRTSTQWKPRARNILLACAAITTLGVPLVYFATYKIASARGLLSGMVGNKPYRDGYRTFFLPWGVGDDHARVLNEQVAKLAGRDGLVLVDDTMQTVGLRYGRAVRRIAGDVEIVQLSLGDEQDHTLASRLHQSMENGRPVILVPRDRDKPRAIAGMQWSRVGDVYVGRATP